jgi:hypothetical protein
MNPNPSAPRSLSDLGFFNFHGGLRDNNLSINYHFRLVAQPEAVH